MYTHTFWDNIESLYEKDFFKQRFWDRETTMPLLDDFAKKLNAALVVVDWTAFSTNFESRDMSKSTNDVWSVDFLNPWTDGFIFTGLNDIDKSILWTKTSIWITMWVWDCLTWTWKDKDSDLIFNFHWWYKWIFWVDNDGKWIIYNLVEELKSHNKTPSDIVLDIWPMAWSDFELWYSDFLPMIEKFLKNYPNLLLRDYFLKQWLNIDKWHLNLRQLSLDVLRYHWFKNISYSSIDTTNTWNSWPSFRLATQSKNENHKNYWKQPIDGRLSSTILKKVS